MGLSRSLLDRRTIFPSSPNARDGWRALHETPCSLRLKMPIYNCETFWRLARCQLLWQTFAPVEFQARSYRLKVCARVWSPGTRWKFYSMLMRLHRKKLQLMLVGSFSSRLPSRRVSSGGRTFSKKSGRLAEESVENAFRRNSSRVRFDFIIQENMQV